MSTFIQIVILLAVLAAMIIVLLGIRQLAHFEKFDNEDETKLLKGEVEKDDRIVSKNSIFHNLVGQEAEVKKNDDYKKTSKDPFSPSE
ncbi:MAG: hypothetical protein J1E82_00270 [Muribaculaceae bacterium]|nr:hypothetical protein [Muribaculaceae bacterium]